MLPSYIVRHIENLTYYMIGYSQMPIKVWHSYGRTTFTVKKFIYFEYLCTYSLVPIMRTYIFMNIIEAAEQSANDP